MGSDIGSTSLISVLYSAAYVTEAVLGQPGNPGHPGLAWPGPGQDRTGLGLGGSRLLFDGGVVVDTIKKFS